MSTLREKLLEKKLTLKENTLKTYVRNMKTLSNKMGIAIKGTEEDIFDIDLLSNHVVVLKKIGNLKPSSQKNLIAGLVSVLRVIDEELYKPSLDVLGKKLSTLAETVCSEYKKNKKSKTQEENWSSIEDLQKCSDFWKQECRGTLETKAECMEEQEQLNMYVASLLYSGKTPITRLELCSCTVISKAEYDKLKEKNKNYLVLNKKKSFLSLNDYKTYGKKFNEFKKHEENIINMPKDIHVELSKCLKASYNPKLLFPKIRKVEVPMTPLDLGRLITKTFKKTGKNLTLNIIRNIYTTEQYATQQTYEQREQLAYSMGTSVNTQLICYNKFVDNDIDTLVNLESEELAE